MVDLRRNIAAAMISSLLAGSGCSIVHKSPNIDYEECSIRAENKNYQIGIEPIDTQREMVAYVGFDLRAMSDRGVIINYLGLQNRGDSGIEVNLAGSGLVNGRNSWHYLPHKDLKYMLGGPEQGTREKALTTAFLLLNPPVMMTLLLVNADSEGIYRNLKDELLPENFTVRPGEHRKGLTALFNPQGERYSPGESTQFVMPLREGDENKITILEMGPLRGLSSSQ